ncbi:hypothetical protein [Roseicella aquatilis]|uniref:DUF2946 domain-containing protein n=1 Tax=Roseicella aquatilis TaxID=2527868 RepID=A0A4R4DTA4_9PROT|nr:hypothetical protein [Roseicella aquatilis]TCZ64006.1 hypothetical protein EXY23_08525 [Roseicella aquatilis]
MRLRGGVRRAVMALLALALLALPGGPMRGPAEAAPRPEAVLHAPCHDGAEADRQDGHGQPAGPHPGLPGPACCLAGPCTGLQGAPPPALALPLPLPVATPEAMPPPGRPGLAVPPARKPPRAA